MPPHATLSATSSAVVDYRTIRDLLRSGQASVTDAQSTPPPPVGSTAHVFRQPVRRAPQHQDVWGSTAHPYDTAPHGITTLLTTGGSEPRSHEDPNADEPPEPPVVMRRTRFFASIRTALNDLHDNVHGHIQEFTARDEDEPEDAGPSITSAMSSEDREEYEKLQQEKMQRFLDGVDHAFESAAAGMGTVLYNVFQYAGSKHVALERIRSNMEQRDEELLEKAAQQAEEAEDKLEAQREKLEEVEEGYADARHEWRKMLVMAHARGVAEKELRDEVAGLKRGMRQLLAEADAAETKFQIQIGQERQMRRDQTALLQQSLHEAQTDAQNLRDSLAERTKELNEANRRLEELHTLVGSMEKQLDKQKERLAEAHKLEAQLKDFFKLQGFRSMADWHKNLRALVGATSHDDELTNGAYGFGKGVLQLFDQQKLGRAYRWLRPVFPESFPVYKSSRRRVDVPPSPAAGGGPSAASPTTQAAPAVTKYKVPHCLPEQMKRLVALSKEAAATQGASMPLKDAHIAIADILNAWLFADGDARSDGLLAFAYRRSLGLGDQSIAPAEDTLSSLIGSAITYAGGAASSPRCKFFCQMLGASDAAPGGVPPVPSVQSSLEAWRFLISGGNEGLSPLENESCLFFTVQDLVKPAVEAVGLPADLHKTVSNKIKVLVRADTNKRARTHGMVCADEVVAVLLEEWMRGVAGAMDTRLRKLFLENDKGVDGKLLLSDFSSILQGMLGSSPEAPFRPSEVVHMYAAAGSPNSLGADGSGGDKGGKLSVDSVMEVAQFFGWSDAGSRASRAAFSMPASEAIRQVWGAMESSVGPQVSALSNASAADMQPVEVLMERCRNVVGPGGTVDSALDAMKTLLSAHGDAVVKALQSPSPRKEPSSESSGGKSRRGTKGSAKGAKVSNKPEDSPEVQQQLDFLRQQVAAEQARADDLEEQLLQARALVPSQTGHEAAAAGLELSSSGPSEDVSGASMLAKLEALRGAAQRIRGDHRALQEQARVHKQAADAAMGELAMQVETALRASQWGAAMAATALASSRSSQPATSGRSQHGQLAGGDHVSPQASSAKLAAELSAEASGYLASPRQLSKDSATSRGVPTLGSLGSLQQQGPPQVDELVSAAMAGVQSESSFQRRVEQDLRAYELEVKQLRFDSRIDGLDELVADTLTPHDRDALLMSEYVGDDEDDEAEDALLEEASGASLGQAMPASVLTAVAEEWAGEVQRDQQELEKVSNILTEAQPGPERSREDLRAGQLLQELSQDTFLRSGPQIPGVEQLVWEGMGGPASGLPPPRPLSAAYSPHSHHPSGDGTRSETSDWDREIETIDASRGNGSTPDQLVAEGTALLHSRSGLSSHVSVGMVGDDPSGSLMGKMDAVREAAKVVDSEAVELERKVDKVRAANLALTARASDLDLRSERLRVASEMLQRQAESLSTKGELVRRERDVLHAEHGRLRSNRDRLTTVAKKLKARKFNLRSAEAIYVRKWHQLEVLAKDLVGMQSALSTCSHDLNHMSSILCDTAAALGLEMSPMVLPPPHAVELQLQAGIAGLSAQQQQSYTSARHATASARGTASSRPSSATPRPRPASASTASMRSSHAANVPYPGPHLQQQQGISTGVIGRPLSADSRHRQLRASPMYVATQPHPPASSFALPSPNWLHEGGDVQDAPRQLHMPLRQIYAVSVRLHHAASAFSGFGSDILGSKPEVLVEASPRDLLHSLAHPPGGIATDDPAVVAALVAEVVQSRIDRRSRTFHGSSPSQPPRPRSAHQLSSSNTSSRHHIPSAVPTPQATDRSTGASLSSGPSQPGAPGPTPRYGPAAELRSRPAPGLLPSYALKQSDDLVNLCHNLMEQSAASPGRQNQRPASGKRPTSGRRQQRTGSVGYVPGQRSRSPPGPVLGGSAVPIEEPMRASLEKQQQQQQQQSPTRRSSDMLTFVTRGVEKQSQQRKANRSAGPANRRLSNNLNRPFAPPGPRIRPAVGSGGVTPFGDPRAGSPISITGIRSPTSSPPRR